MKILYIATIAPTLSFFKSIIKRLIEEGNTVDIAANEAVCPPDGLFSELGCRFYSIPWGRNPFSWENMAAIKKLKGIVEENRYDIVHCHTPIAAACTRLACGRLRKGGLKVIYTAHGFHFFKGAPIKNWLIYFPIEWLCSFLTDVIITINQEDYHRAAKHFHAKEALYVPGVGADIGKFSLSGFDKAKKRKQLGLSEDDYIILSVGELNENKNHLTVLQALSQIKQDNCKYLIAGEGSLHGELDKTIDTLNLRGRAFLLGFRGDISELVNCADLFILPSLREGLSVATIEAIASKTPVLCSDIRGPRELVNRAQTFRPTDTEAIRSMICDAMTGNGGCASAFVEENFNRIQRFSIENVNRMMLEIYHQVNKTSV